MSLFLFCIFYSVFKKFFTGEKITKSCNICTLLNTDGTSVELKEGQDSSWSNRVKGIWIHFEKVQLE